MELITYPDAELMMMDLANRLAGELKNCLLLHPWASFAVPGGTTPGPIFDSLSAADLEWDRVHVMLTDERWVPESSDRSNTSLVRARLLQNRAAAAKFIPYYDGSDTPELAMAALGETLAAETPFSILLLGMGADMHTASLFPGAVGLDAAFAPDAPMVVPIRGGGAPEPRVSLSARALKSAMTTHIVIKGEEKRAALERVQSLTDHDAPVKIVLPNAIVHWAES